MDVDREAGITEEQPPGEQRCHPRTTWQGKESWSGGREQQAVVAGSGHWREMCSHAGGPTPSTAHSPLEVLPEPALSTVASLCALTGIITGTKTQTSLCYSCQEAACLDGNVIFTRLGGQAVGQVS